LPIASKLLTLPGLGSIITSGEILQAAKARRRATARDRPRLRTPFVVKPHDEGN